ncbi:hypothetical protein AD998_19855 [bacterium 336/3]|nr:hypothetical protein AD998_19855 [bacterium 336/3]
MKKIFLLGAIILLINDLSFGQSKGSCSVVLCSEVKENERGNTQINNVFTGFSANAVGSTVKFIAYIRFQNYSLNQVHKFYITLENDATGEKIIDNSDRQNPFSLFKKQAVYAHQSILKVNFPKEGIYRLRVYVDDKEEESLYMEIGD